MQRNTISILISSAAIAISLATLAVVVRGRDVPKKTAEQYCAEMDEGAAAMHAKSPCVRVEVAKTFQDIEIPQSVTSFTIQNITGGDFIEKGYPCYVSIDIDHETVKPGMTIDSPTNLGVSAQQASIMLAPAGTWERQVADMKRVHATCDKSGAGFYFNAR